MNQNITQQIQVVQRSEIGLKRNVNQDSIGVRLPLAGQSSAHALFIVADGVGGNLPKGEVASRTAVESMLAHYYAESDETDMLMRVGDSLQDTNMSVRQKAISEGVDSIGTTIVGFSLAPDGEAIGFNVGDSRLYRIRGGEIERISEDQVSLPEPGVLKDEFKPRRVTKISSYIGQPNMLEPNFYRLKTQVGDTYLLCSDGVWSKVPDEELLDTIDQQPLEQASERLVKLVYERNAPDNLSLVLVRLGPPRGPAAVAAPIGEMPTAILTPSDRGEKGGSRIVPILIGVGVVVAAAIGGISLLSQQGNSSNTPTPPVTIQQLMITTTAEETEAVAAAATDEPVENTAAPTTTVITATDTATKAPTLRPSATPTEAASPSPVPPTNTPKATATLKPSATATDEPTDLPTDEPTVIVLIVPTETATKAPTKVPSATPTVTDEPTIEPTEVATETSTPLPTRTVAPTTTVNPTLITYTPSPTLTITPSLTRTPSPTPSETFTPTVTMTRTATATFTPSATLSNQQVEATGTAFARITPSPVPTLYAPQPDEVVTLSQAVMFYPSRNGASFTLPASGGVELPPDTKVRVVSNLAEPIDNLIYSYVVVEGETEQQGWAALAPAMQAYIVAHLPAGVIIRRGPGQGYERVGLGLKDGERAAILGKVTYKGQLWYYVDPENAQSQAGWVYSGVRDLEVQGSVTNVPIRNSFPVEPTPLPTPTEDVATLVETPTATP